MLQMGNDKQNDLIISKLSDKDDMWLHTKDCAGSHILIKNPERKIIEDVYLSLNTVKKGVQLNNNDIYRKNYLKNYDIGQEGCNC